MPEPFYRWQNNDLLLFCQLQPKTKNDEFAGVVAGETIGKRCNQRIKIRITAPPIDGKANQHLIKFLAKQFGVAKSAISIESGELGKQKNVLVKQPTKIPAILSIEQAE